MRLVISRPGKIEIEEMACPSNLGDNEILVKTLFSGISHGTEMHAYKDAKYLEGGHAWLRYPGYANIGRIMVKGRDVKGFSEGDIVSSFANHCTACVIKAGDPNLVKLPLGLPPQAGVFRANLGTAFNGVLDAGLHLGETAAVFGLGVIGQLAAQLIRRSGAKVIGVDLHEKRLALARELGLDYVLNVKDGNVGQRIMEMTEGRGADVAMEASGSDRALNEAIRSVVFQGTVVALSWYWGNSSNLYLDDAFHNKRVVIKASQTGNIDPSLSNRWNKERRTRVCLALLAELNLQPLITHAFDFKEAQKAYDLIANHPEEAVQVILKY